MPRLRTAAQGLKILDFALPWTSGIRRSALGPSGCRNGRIRYVVQVLCTCGPYQICAKMHPKNVSAMYVQYIPTCMYLH